MYFSNNFCCCKKSSGASFPKHGCQSYSRLHQKANRNLHFLLDHLQVIADDAFLTDGNANEQDHGVEDDSASENETSEDGTDP